MCTFPRATAVVAMSRIKESPFLPGAARVRGFVPRAGFLALVGLINGDVFVNESP